MENQNFNLEQTLLEFNQDPNFIELRERYSTRSFLEIMSVERSENRHSSFLAWLLGAKDFAVNPKDHPIVHLLDVLIKRLGEQGEKSQGREYKAGVISGKSGLKNTILSRGVKDVIIEEVKTEKPVKDISIQGYKTKIKDRIDIYIKCCIFTSTRKSHEFDIIIENKIGSSEGEEKNENKYTPADKNGNTDWYQYCTSYQTERYYTACNDKKNTVFVFLTPDGTKAEDKHYINITYQDILDNILEPLLLNGDISERIQVLLKEYVLALSLPGQYVDEDSEENKDVKSAIILAERKKLVDKILDIFNNETYKKLIILAAKCLIDKANPCFIKDEKEKVFIKKHSNLLESFGNTYKNLFIVLLKIYTDANSNDTDLKKIYVYLCNPNPRDHSVFTVKDRNGSIIQDEVKKGKFTLFIIKEYIKCWNDLNLEHPVLNLEHPVKYFGDLGQKNPEYYPLCKVNEAKPKDLESKRFFDKTSDIQKISNESYYVTTQWGSKEDKEPFDVLFRKIFDEQNLSAIENYKIVSTSNKDLTLSFPWNSILKGYSITIKRIFK